MILQDDLVVQLNTNINDRKIYLQKYIKKNTEMQNTGLLSYRT